MSGTGASLNIENGNRRQILELARDAQRQFERQEPRQKRRLLNFVLSNCTGKDGEVVITFRQPFDLLAETTAIAARRGAANTAKSAKSEIWLTTQSLANWSLLLFSFFRGRMLRILLNFSRLEPLRFDTETAIIPRDIREVFVPFQGILRQ